MTTFNTSVHNSTHGGKMAETLVPASHGRHLNIVTMKRYSGALSTTITGVTVDLDNGRGFAGYSYMMYQDYCKNPVSERVRCTEKAVRAQHQAILDNIQAYLDEAEEFYKAKG